jgi:hypothetical protein
LSAHALEEVHDVSGDVGAQQRGGAAEQKLKDDAQGEQRYADLGELHHDLSDAIEPFHVQLLESFLGRRGGTYDLRLNR